MWWPKLLVSWWGSWAYKIDHREQWSVNERDQFGRTGSNWKSRKDNYKAEMARLTLTTLGLSVIWDSIPFLFVIISRNHLNCRCCSHGGPRDLYLSSARLVPCFKTHRTPKVLLDCKSCCISYSKASTYHGCRDLWHSDKSRSSCTLIGENPKRNYDRSNTAIITGYRRPLSSHLTVRKAFASFCTKAINNMVGTAFVYKADRAPSRIQEYYHWAYSSSFNSSRRYTHQRCRPTLFTAIHMNGQIWLPKQGTIAASKDDYSW